MDLETFEDHLDRHGGDFARWPVSVRSAAASFAGTSQAAGKALEAARSVEAYLWTTGPASVGTGGESFAAVATRHRQVLPTRRLAVGAGWGVAAAIVLVFGYSIGDLSPIQHDDNPDRVMAVALDSQSVIDVD